MTKFSTSANAAQTRAIKATEGPVLIIAGPGSGKTFTLVERIVHLIIEHGVKPESLFVVTFTDKAARELITRISNRLNELAIKFNLHEMYVGTFHSICLRMVDEHREFTRLKRNYTVMDQFDQQYFLYQRINEYRKIADSELLLGADASRWNQSLELVKWLNKVTEEALDPDELAKAAHPEVRTLAACYALYQHQLDEANALDFSTIQLEALHLLESSPEVLEGLRKQLTYLMVDEYQDTNTIQERILRRLLNEKQNLCVVGDDDQGLYRFRGATIRNILEFPQQFESGKCRQIKLTVNYRSHPSIIEFYNKWMGCLDWTAEGKTFRFAKKIEPEQKDFPAVPTVLRVSASVDGNWHDEVLEFLRCLYESGQLHDWNQIAFLFKSVKNPRVIGLAEHLEAHGIPVYSPRSDMFFSREEIRLMIGALIFLFPQFPEVRKGNADFELEIWEYYDHQCLAPFLAEIKRPENAALLAWAKSAAKRHFRLSQNADYAFAGIFYDLLRFPLFSRYLSDEAMQGIDKGRAARNLGRLSALLSKFEYLHHVSVLDPKYLDRNIQQLFNQFIRFLKQGGIGEYEDDSEYAPKGCVSFLTIHQSKGLEFPIVIVGSLEAVPRKQFTALDEILEQGYLSKPAFEPLESTKFFDFWRLYYTAFSRAQNLLVLTCQEKEGRGRTPSKYFEDVYQDLPSWRENSFKPKKLHFENVKEINLKREYSFTSHITLYENCSEQYRMFKELEFTPTSAVTAQRLGRRFIGADINAGAIQTTIKRLLGETDEHGLATVASGDGCSGSFDIYNVNSYDVFRNPVEAKDLLIEALEIQKLEFNGIYDGEKDGRLVKILPVNRIATRADLADLIVGFDYKSFQKRQHDNPSRAVEKILLVCMGHEPDLKAHLQKECSFKLDVEIVDILRDRSNLEFKRESQAKVALKKKELVIERFYPMNLLQKLSIQKEHVTDWRELVESVMIDWNYDGAVLQPAVVDIPEKNAVVSGAYPVPADAGTIMVKITDLLSESLEIELHHG